MPDIRRASPADAPGIADVHIRAWSETYRGIVPQDYIDALTYQKRLALWQNVLEPGGDTIVHVAEIEQVIVGFSSAGPLRSEEDLADHAELYAVYLLDGFKGKDLGRRLFETACNDLRRNGYRHMTLWVLEANPACGFYERLGGKIVDEKTQEFGAISLKEIAYGWTFAE